MSSNVSLAGAIEPAQLARQLERERQARKSAETLLESKSLELYEANERLQRLNASLSDANGELRAEVELRRQAEQHLTIYAEVVRSTGDAVIITELDGTIVDVNPAYECVIGRSRAELIGSRLYADLPGEDADGLRGTLWHSLQTRGHWMGELLDRRSNGESFPSWVLINAVRDERGEPLRYVCVARDITALKQSEEQLKRLAFYDSLTQLPNRALFNDRLSVALKSAGRRQTLGAVLYLDLDRFKDINDTLGHAAGDRLLVEVARRIEVCVRATDTVARRGGDEFMILLTHIGGEADAVDVAQRVIDAVSRPIRLDDKTVQVGASLGLSFYPRDAKDGDGLHQRADLALYEAKQGGRSQYRIFSPEMLTKGEGRLSLSMQIGAALTREEFQLAYQPIVNLHSGRVDSVEALIRWYPPGAEPIPPAKFIPHAEEAGFIKRIDRWVLERACRDALQWQQAGRQGPRVCVNLSAVTVQQPDIVHTIEDVLQRTGLPPQKLVLEITETAVITDPAIVHRVLDEVVRLGVGLSLDDFGTGYSSLSYLTRFPISCIKLDRSFVERVGSDRASEELVRSLVELAHKLRLRVVAEGIEGPREQALLMGMGCELLQGFHLARPMPNERLSAWLSTYRAPSR